MKEECRFAARLHQREAEPDEYGRVTGAGGVCAARETDGHLTGLRKPVFSFRHKAVYFLTFI